MTCSSCGHRNPDGAKFCAECGTGLARACASCKAANAAAAKFCTSCGTPLGAAATSSPPEPAPLPRERRAEQAERRQITVVFCDLASSTELAARMDPEDFRDVIGEFQQAAGEAVAEHDGHVAQHLGDGLLVYFGYPRAHEDDPVRAVRAALGLIERLQGAGERLPPGVRLSVRIGIHTGPVVVGLVGAAGADEQLAIGETPNLAARLQALAEPGTVLLSETTARRTRHVFELVEREPAVLKGFHEARRVFQVAGPRRAGAAGREHDAVTPLIGREAEISALRTLWERAREGAGCSVVIRGEPGVGKSRLCALFGDWVRGDARELHARCSTYFTHSAMRPLADLVVQLAGWHDEDPRDVRASALERAVAGAGLSVADHLPLLSALVGLGEDVRFPLPTLSPQIRRRRVIASVVDLLLASARRTPLLVCIEDLHWVDDSTIEVLGTLIDRVAEAPLLLVLTCRQHFETPWQVDSEIALHRLPRAAVERIVLHATGGRALPAEVVQQIVLKADGNPLFVEELTRMVLESGLLVETADGTLKPGADRLPAIAIPATLHDSLMARLDRLSPTHRTLVQLCATVGRQFSYELIDEIVRQFDSDIRPELRRLSDGELLYQRGEPPRSTFIFRHALIQDAAYESLLHRTRARYHSRVADVLMARFPDTPPEVLAHHLTEAGRTKEAIERWQAAGQAALSAFALGDAFTHLTRGLSLRSKLRDDDGAAEAELGLRVLLGVPLMLTQGFASPDVESNCRRMLELCESEASGPAAMFPALWGLWTFSIVGGEHERAEHIGGRLLALARRTGDRAIELAGHTAEGAALLMRGRFAEARRALESGLQVYDRAQHAPLALLFGQDAGAMCASFLVWVHAWTGEDERAKADAARAAELCEALAQPGTSAFVGTVLATWYCFAGDYARGEAHSDAVVALAAEQGMPHWDAQAQITRGWALAGLARADEGVERMRSAIALLTGIGSRATMTVYWAGLAEAELALGRVEAAQQAIARALEMVERGDERLHEAGLYLLSGRVALARSGAGAAPDARRWFERAIEVARRQGAAGLERRAMAQLASIAREAQ